MNPRPQRIMLELQFATGEQSYPGPVASFHHHHQGGVPGVFYWHNWRTQATSVWDAVMSGSEIFLRVHTAVRHGVGREVLSLPDMNGQGPGVEFEPAAIHVKIRNEAKTPHKKCRSCETTQHSSSRTSCGSGTAAARRAG